VVSPFSNPAAAQPSTGGTGGLYSAESYELTLKNVDMVLEEVRPYLVADGGNVEVVGVADGVISLRLQGDFLFPLTHFYLSVCEEVQQHTSSGGTALLLNNSLHFHMAVQHCISLLSASRHHDQVFPLLPEMQQKLRTHILYNCVPRFRADYLILVYTHCQELMMSVGAHGSLFLLICDVYVC
jgi:hypothetical protein